MCARRKVKKEEYGPFTTHTMEKLRFKPPPNQEKLISDVYPLEHHYIHYTILKQVLALGIELVQVHRVVRYMYTKKSSRDSTQFDLLLSFIIHPHRYPISFFICLRFHQAPWLAPYIRFNNEQRRQSTDLVSKDFFKLLNNR